MGNTRKRRIGRALALAVGTAAVALPFASAPPASAAPLPTGTITDSVELTSLPANATLSLPKIDPTTVDIFGLTEVTITATLESSLTGHVENLSTTHAKTIGVGAHVDLTMTSDALSSDLQAGHSHTETLNLAPGASSPVDLADSDEFTEVVDQAGLLDALFDVLVGETGTIDFDLSGVVDTFVNGPAPYLSTGVAAGKASVTIDYEYVEVCEYDPSLPADDPNCVPPPPPECEVTTDIQPQEGDHPLDNGGTFTITDIYQGTLGEAFDWESDVLVYQVVVKGGPGDLVFDYPAGAMSGTELHSNVNPNNGTWFGLSHIEVCALPLEGEQGPEGEPGEPGEKGPQGSRGSTGPSAATQKSGDGAPAAAQEPADEPEPEPAPEPEEEPEPEPAAEEPKEDPKPKAPAEEPEAKESEPAATKQQAAPKGDDPDGGGDGDGDGSDDGQDAAVGEAGADGQGDQ